MISSPPRIRFGLFFNKLGDLPRGIQIWCKFLEILNKKYQKQTWEPTT